MIGYRDLPPVEFENRPDYRKEEQPDFDEKMRSLVKEHKANQTPLDKLMQENWMATKQLRHALKKPNVNTKIKQNLEAKIDLINAEYRFKINALCESMLAEQRV